MATENQKLVDNWKTDRYIERKIDRQIKSVSLYLKTIKVAVSECYRSVLIFKIPCKIQTDQNTVVEHNKTVMIGITKITTKDKDNNNDKGNNKDKDTTTTTTTKNNNNNVQQFVMRLL